MPLPNDPSQERRLRRRLNWEIAAAVVVSVAVVVISVANPDWRLPSTAPDGVAKTTDATAPAAKAADDAIRRLALARRLLHEGQAVNSALVALSALPPAGAAPATGTTATVLDLQRLLYAAHLGRREAAVLRGHLAIVRFVRFTPDGRRVFTGASDRTGALWAAADGARTAEMTGHDDKVWAGALSRDGRLAATASVDGTVRLWDAATGAPGPVMRGHTAAVVAVAFAAGGARLVSASHDATLRLWETGDGTGIATLRGHADKVLAVAVGPAGQRIGSGAADGTVRLWRAADGAPVPDVGRHDGAVLDVDFSPDGRWLLSASADGTARLWDAVAGRPGPVLRGHRGDVNSARFSPDGTTIVTASRDGTARLWRAADGTLLHVLAGHASWVNVARFSPDGRHVASASRDWTARLWSVADGRQEAVFAGHDNDVVALDFSPDGARLVTAAGDATARLWDVRDGVAVSVAPVGRPPKAGPVAVHAAAGRRAQIIADQAVRLSATGYSGTVAELRGHTDSVRTVAFSPGGAALLSASDDGTVRLWRAADGAHLATLTGDGMPMAAAAFKGDGRVVTASAAGTVRHYRLPATAAALAAYLRDHLPRRLTPYQRYQWGLGRAPVDDARE